MCKWTDIKGYDGIYQISDNGKVKSLNRKEKYSGFKRERKERNLKQIIRSKYLSVNLCIGGKTKILSVHRLVALAFVQNPENKPEVDHIDGNKLNNHSANLRWVTSKENSNNPNAPCNEIGKQLNKGGKKVLQFDLDGNLINEWLSTMEIQRQLGFKRGNISNCCNGLIKRSYGYIWKYSNTKII